MVKFRILPLAVMPKYMTELSAGADLYANEDRVIEPLQTVAVSTGVFIESYDRSAMPAGVVGELQIRARSSLAFKHGILLANGVGTVDLDYPDEIKVLLWNSNHEKSFTVSRGDRIAQILLAYTYRLPQFDVGGLRKGGFGSTDLNL